MKPGALRMSSVVSWLRPFGVMFSSHPFYVFALMLILLMAPAPAAASIVELDVSGTFTPATPPLFGGTCSSSGCTIGGDIVINNTLDVVTSADVTASGFGPAMGPFTIFAAVADGFGTQTVIQLSDAADQTLDFVFNAPVQGSLAGYTGGPLNTGSEIYGAEYSPAPLWFLTSGSLTAVPPATVPEPSSVVLLVPLVAIVGFLTRRKLARELAKRTPQPTA
jgi:hypothetical protein